MPTFLNQPYLGHKVVVVDVVAEEALLFEVGHSLLHHLVEDVVGPLHLLWRSQGNWLTFRVARSFLTPRNR